MWLSCLCGSTLIGACMFICVDWVYSCFHRATLGALWLVRGMMSASSMGASAGERAAVALESLAFTLKWWTTWTGSIQWSDANHRHHERRFLWILVLMYENFNYIGFFLLFSFVMLVKVYRFLLTVKHFVTECCWLDKDLSVFCQNPNSKVVQT